MKTVLLLLLLSSLQLVANASDTIPIPPVVNIYLHRPKNSSLFLKLANKPTVELATVPHDEFLDSWTERYFYRLILNSTGYLKFYVTQLRFLSLKVSFTKEPLITIPVQFTGERWLYISNRNYELDNLKKGRYELLTTEEFKNKYPTAYSKFIKRGFNMEFENVEVNVEPEKTNK
jgi:hypothetical protein